MPSRITLSQTFSLPAIPKQISDVEWIPNARKYFQAYSRKALFKRRIAHMPYISLNPATNKTMKTYTSWDSLRLAAALEEAHEAQQRWAAKTFGERAECMHGAARLLHERIEQ